MEKLLLLICLLGVTFTSVCHGLGATLAEIEKFRQYHIDHKPIRIWSFFENNERMSAEELCNKLEANSKVRIANNEKYVAVQGWYVPSYDIAVTLPGSNEIIKTQGMVNCKMQITEHNFTYIYYVLCGKKEYLEVKNKDPNYIHKNSHIPDHVELIADVQPVTGTSSDIMVEPKPEPSQ